MVSFIIYLLIAAIGFMMGFLYKRSHSSSQFFSPDPVKMFRIFILTLVLAIIFVLGVSWYGSHSLSPDAIPEENALRFENTKSVVVFSINFFFFLLVILANAYSQALKRIAFLPYLLAACFYVAFILADAYFISDTFTLWQKSLQIFQIKVTDLNNIDRLKCGLAITVTCFNAFMIWWGMRK